MNLWRRLSERDAAEEAEPPDRAKRENAAAAKTSFVPRLDIALEIAAVMARIVLDPRVTFAIAIAVAVLVPGRTGELVTAFFVAFGSLLVYRAERWRRIPDHLRWLGRVGAYYHDIGKLRKPQHFVENQPRGRNPHDKLKPSTSASIIRSHVRDGIELAKENGVPRPIRAFIAEHHGTLPISYFLAKARERDDSVNATEYAYPGPIPQSAETAICMLADAAEATVRSLADPTPPAIRATVEATIAQRIGDGQLADAPITLRQLSVVREQFVRILTGMYHGRIEYPAPVRPLAIAPKPDSRASA